MSSEKTSMARISHRPLTQGETLLKGGSKTPAIYFVESGRLMVNLSRDGIIELHQSTPPQCLGEEVLFGSPTVHASSLAIENSEVVEVPLELARAQLDNADPILGLILKGVAERLRVTSNELKTVKMAKGSLPCPPDLTAKVFGTIYHAALYVGKKEGHTVEAKWDEFKEYAIDVMEESMYRIIQALNILAKLGYAELLIEEKGIILFQNMTQIEAFFDFYQNYHFKSSYANLLKTNDKITAITQAVLKISEKYQADRAGVIHMPFKPAIDALKKILGATFEADQLFRLEQKGLMVKRVATQDGGILSFYKPEFEQMLLNWKVLKEVELWNQRGYVDMSQYVSPQEQAARNAEMQRVSEKLAAWKPPALRGELPTIRTSDKKPGELFCPICMSTVTNDQRTCDVCDNDLTVNKAA